MKGHTASVKKLEDFGKSRIKTARAYSLTHDECARWPAKNFSDVVKTALADPGRDDYDVLVMSAAPTVDITNLDTSKLVSSDNTDQLQEKVMISSQNMFNIAVTSLKKNKNLSKVVIMEHPPRFDKKEVDPTSLKPALVRFANSTLSYLWLNSPLKDRIVIGSHSLESSGSGETYHARYVTRTGRQDGVHFWGQNGREQYTNSVKNIFMMAKLNNISDKEARTPSGVSKNRNNERYHPSVETMNRFSAFNHNQGN